MTWILESAGAASCRPQADDHDALDAELAPGVDIERRSVLWMPLAAAAGLLFGRAGRLLAEGAAAAGATSAGGGPLSWEDFIKQAVPVAKDLVKDRTSDGQDAYLMRLASMAVRLTAAPNTRLFPFGGLQPAVEFAPSFRGVPFLVIQWRMRPRAILPAHCHPQSSVCTVGLEGQARLRNFEVHGEAPAFNSGSRKPFLIRETHNEVIGPRRVNTLSPSRDNIHYFEAGPDGARGLDITTTYSGSGDFSFVAFEPDKPRDPGQRLFEAVWIGRKPKG